MRRGGKRQKKQNSLKTGLQTIGPKKRAGKPQSSRKQTAKGGKIAHHLGWVPREEGGVRRSRGRGRGDKGSDFRFHVF